MGPDVRAIDVEHAPVDATLFVEREKPDFGMPLGDPAPASERPAVAVDTQ